MNVIRTKAAYEKANDTLKDLPDKRDVYCSMRKCLRQSKEVQKSMRKLWNSLNDEEFKMAPRFYVNLSAVLF